MSAFRTLPLATLALLVTLPAAAQNLKLGELNSYKVFPAFLEPYKKGMELALEEVNAGGGVLGPGGGWFGVIRIPHSTRRNDGAGNLDRSGDGRGSGHRA